MRLTILSFILNPDGWFEQIETISKAYSADAEPDTPAGMTWAEIGLWKKDQVQVMPASLEPGSSHQLKPSTCN